ncbi:MAG: hypothetical protein JXB49_16330 [Bacteroidales bacterium]|nr:hypothetical protein [Bacteroidales bacterium]
MSEDKKSPVNVDQLQIDAWKKQFGNVYELESEGIIGYVRSPGRNELSYATTVSKGNDPMAFNEAILNSCWLGGDERLKTDEKHFLGVCSVLEQIIETTKATIKKL